MTHQPNWRSFFTEQPTHGQKIFYYGEYIGVWQGTYEYHPNDMCSPHIIICAESPGVVDRMDAPWWIPHTGQDKPAPPPQPYPDNYPT